MALCKLTSSLSFLTHLHRELVKVDPPNKQSRIPSKMSTLSRCCESSWTLHLRTLHLQMLYLRHFIFGQFNLRAVTPSEISPSGCYTLWMFPLRTVTPSGSYTFGGFTFGGFTLREVTTLDFSPSNVFRNCGSCKVLKV